MNAIRKLAFAAIAGVGAAAEAVNNGTPQGEVIAALPMVARDDTCAGLPKLCTGSALLNGHATTLTYLCPRTAQEPSTVHVTVTKTTTVTLPGAETTQTPAVTPVLVAPAPAPEDSVTTTTIHSTLTQYKTVTLVRNTAVSSTLSVPALPITGYMSVTIPTELLSIATPHPSETEEPIFTIQTSTTPNVTSGYAFPTFSPPVINGTTTGIFYSGPGGNSSVAHSTAFFPNTTSGRSHYALPTLNVANRAADATETVKGVASKGGVSLSALVIGVMAVALVV